MKHIFLVSIILFSTLFSQAQDLNSRNEPFIKLEQEVLDYGTIKKGSDGKRVIKVSNTGKKPLIITKCDGSCGCTVPTCPSTTIAPGDSSEITIEYDTSREGSFNKRVTIKSNAENHVVYLKVVGVVEP